MAWQKDGGNDFPAARERRMHVMPDDNAFFIVNAKICDHGVYTCTAENPAGIIKVNATVTILGKACDDLNTKDFVEVINLKFAKILLEILTRLEGLAMDCLKYTILIKTFLQFLNY